MGINAFLVAIFIAGGFVGWPIVGGWSQASSGWVGVTVCSMTTITLLLLSFGQFGSDPVPSARSIAVLVVAGVVNGVAVYYYTARTTDPSTPTAAFVVLVSVCMVICAPLLAFIVAGSVPTSRQMIGFAFAIPTIYLLAGK